MTDRPFDAIVVGAGQAGLATGYFLARARLRFVILDAGRRIGDAWRQRWDSLRLFTPACADTLPGSSFPAEPDHYPGKDEMADYLERYAAGFGLPVELGVRVDHLGRESGRYVLRSGDRRLAADAVVVATGAACRPKLPDFASRLTPAVRQVQSADYRNPAQLGSGATLVVGAGNSGSEIALELARDRPVVLSGRDPGRVPVPLSCLGVRVLRRIPAASRLGRWVVGRLGDRGDPVVRVSATNLDAAGVKRVPRVVGVRDGLPLLEDGRVVSTTDIVWATGLGPDFGWIDLPVFDARGRLRHRRGVAIGSPNLFVVGQRFQRTLASQLVGGVAGDARFVVQRIASTTGAG